MSTYVRKTNRVYPPRLAQRRLTPDQVAQIRDSRETGAVLAARFRVSEVAIWCIRHRVTYRELPGGEELETSKGHTGK